MRGSMVITQSSYTKGIYLIRRGEYEILDKKWVLSVVGVGEIVGLSELINDEKCFWYGLKCRSAAGVLIMVPKREMK